MRFFLLLLGLMVLTQAPLTAQSAGDTTRHHVETTLHVNAYYAHRNSDSEAGAFDPFLSAGPRNKQFGLNVARATLAYIGPGVRGSFAYQVGDLPASSWSGMFPQIQEANLGLRLAPKVWIDAGYFLTHIGFESIYPDNKYLSSTAYLSFNEPFFQSGLRLGYTPDDRWSFTLWVLNGYNSFVDNNDAKSAGVTIAYAPTDATYVTYNNLLGNESTDDNLTRFRTVHNLYWTQDWSDRFTSVFNVTAGTQRNSVLDDPQETAGFYGAYLTLDYDLSERWNATLRLETFDDREGVLSGTVPTTNPTRSAGLQISAATLSGQYKPTINSYVRAETRLSRQVDEIAVFTRDGISFASRLELLVTAGVSFGWGWGW